MRFHPESPELTRTHLAQLQFIADFRARLHAESAPPLIAAARELAKSTADDRGAEPTRAHFKKLFESNSDFQLWSAMLRSSQDLLWRVIQDAVLADRTRLESRFAESKGPNVNLNPGMTLPSYITQSDTHRMPGGYQMDNGQLDVSAGAVYDVGGVIYQLGIGNQHGAMLNDSRGRTVLSHIKFRSPSFKPKRILDLGCGVGQNTVPLKTAFPDAEVVGVDVGAAVLRYAKLRAEGLGVELTLSQQNAEATDFEDNSFDLVVSQIVLHETSPSASERIIRESVRITKPGGLVVHLEVPIRYEFLDPVEQTFLSWEQYYNNEPNIEYVGEADFAALLSEAGLIDVRVGFQAIPKAGDSNLETSFTKQPLGGFGRAWFVASGQKKLGA